MKLLLSTNDPTTIAFATAMLRGEGIECFEMDVHTSIIEGSTGAIRRRLMVRDSDHFLAVAVLRDNGIAMDG